MAAFSPLLPASTESVPKLCVCVYVCLALTPENSIFD